MALQGRFESDSDIDAEAITWCKENFPAFAQFWQNSEWPPLPFGDARFDLIYSVSVFTHLPEDMQLAWLAELCRVAKPDAWVLLTIHGSELLPSSHSEATEQMASGGYAYHRGETTDGLPDFYRTAWHSESYIRSVWGRFLEVEKIAK